MLSYRHAFHAGNHADMLKHSTLFLILQSLLKKDKPFTYMDTHAGGGIYDLSDERARQTGESDRGILRVLSAAGGQGEAERLLAPWIEWCRGLAEARHIYPGSPEIARRFCREKDNIILTELHNTEINVLRANMKNDPRVHIHHRSGYEALRCLSPPQPRRGTALTDPSYETASDYTDAPAALIKAAERWNSGILTLWYPLLPHRLTETADMKKAFASSRISGILCAELTVAPPASAGLYGSGLIIIRPPWRLADELAVTLPFLAHVLCPGGNGTSRVTVM